MKSLTRQTLRIVHVDENKDFVDLTVQSLRRAGFNQPIGRCIDGTLALHYFSMIDPSSAPHIILSSFHLPGAEGWQVLHWIRHNYSLRDVEMYVLTATKDRKHGKQQAGVPATEETPSKLPLLDKLIEKLDSLILLRNHLGLGINPELMMSGDFLEGSRP